MKKIILLSLALIAFSCKKESQESFGKEEEKQETNATAPDKEFAPEELGKIIFESKGACVSCHKAEEKLVGPSLQEIAKTYKEKNASIVSFLKGESDAIVDPTQFAVMQANLALTKTFTNKELEGLEAYINTNLK